MNIGDLIPIGGSNIKSIQRGETTFAYNLAILNIAISEIDINKSIVKISIRSGSSTTTANIFLVKAKITSATNLEFTRWASTPTSGQDTYISWEVIEFNNVKSLQKGDYSIVAQNTQENVAISQIDLSKSILFASYTGSGSTTNTTSAHIKTWLVSNTQMSFMTTVYLGTIHWQVIEFN